MKLTIHLASFSQPIATHGQDQPAICGETVKGARPVIIVPDITFVSVESLWEQFGMNGCRHCQAKEPMEEYLYFLAAGQELMNIRRELDDPVEAIA